MAGHLLLACCRPALCGHDCGPAQAAICTDAACLPARQPCCLPACMHACMHALQPCELTAPACLPAFQDNAIQLIDSDEDMEEPAAPTTAPRRSTRGNKYKSASERYAVSAWDLSHCGAMWLLPGCSVLPWCGTTASELPPWPGAGQPEAWWQLPAWFLPACMNNATCILRQPN